MPPTAPAATHALGEPYRFLPLLLVLFVGSGLSALIYEVAWSRQLGLVLGTTVHAVATVLACTMGGMAAGALLGGSIARRARDPLRWHVAFEALLAADAIATGALLRALPALHAAIGHDLPSLSLRWTFERLAMAAVVLAMPTLLMGATFPLACAAAARRWGPAGLPVGRLYAANLAGAACGVILSGFVLIELVGLDEHDPRRRRPEPRRGGARGPDRPDRARSGGGRRVSAHEGRR